MEGLNCSYDLRGKSDDFPGIMMRVEDPLNVLTDIKLVDPSDQQVTDPFKSTNEVFNPKIVVPNKLNLIRNLKICIFMLKVTKCFVWIVNTLNCY